LKLAKAILFRHELLSPVCRRGGETEPEYVAEFARTILDGNFVQVDEESSLLSEEVIFGSTIVQPKRCRDGYLGYDQDT
jgi:hypothetical protein